MRTQKSTPLPNLPHDETPHGWLGGGIKHALIQCGILLACFEIYRVMNGLSSRQASKAHINAAQVVHFEQWLGIFLEPQAQRLTWSHHGLPFALGVTDGSLVRNVTVTVYAHGHITWLATMLLWVYLFRRDFFSYIRNMIVATSMIAILLPAVFPVAPPRFTLIGAPFRMADLTGVPVSEQTYAHLAGFDLYSALPSVHVLWAMLTGLGLWLGSPRTSARLLCLLFPLTVSAAVVVTGNHYVLDCVAAAAILWSCQAAQWCWKTRWSPTYVPTPRVREQAAAAMIHALDGPLVVCACFGTILLAVGDRLQHLAGMLILCCACVALIHAQRRLRRGGMLCSNVPQADWWCGLLLVAGATAVDADQATLRAAGAVLWCIAAAIPLAARIHHEAASDRTHADPVCIHADAASLSLTRDRQLTPG